jgi:acetoin utilization protein AcuB
MADLRALQAHDWMMVSYPTITPRTTINTALRLFREHRTPVIPVCSEGRCVGLVDEKALLRLTPSEATSLSIYEIRPLLDRATVTDVMTPPITTVTPETPLDEVARLMVHESADIVPVVSAGYLVGLLPMIFVLAAAVGQAPHDCHPPSSRPLCCP